MRQFYCRSTKAGIMQKMIFTFFLFSFEIKFAIIIITFKKELIKSHNDNNFERKLFKKDFAPMCFCQRKKCLILLLWQNLCLFWVAYFCSYFRLHHSQRSNLLTVWLQNMWLLKNGPNWADFPQKLPGLPLPKPLLALLNSTINIVVFMLVMRIPTRSLLMSLTPSLRNTMASQLVSNIPQTWMLKKLMAISTQQHQFTGIYYFWKNQATELEANFSKNRGVPTDNHSLSLSTKYPYY